MGFGKGIDGVFLQPPKFLSCRWRSALWLNCRRLVEAGSAFRARLPCLAGDLISDCHRGGAVAVCRVAGVGLVGCCFVPSRNRCLVVVTGVGEGLFLFREPFLQFVHAAAGSCSGASWVGLTPGGCRWWFGCDVWLCGWCRRGRVRCGRRGWVGVELSAFGVAL